MTDLRAYARGQECQIRLIGICNGNWETTVLAHWRGIDISGAALKADDFIAAHACGACHDAVDSRSQFNMERDFRELAHAHGVMRTQALLIARGVVVNGRERVVRPEKLLKRVPRRFA